MSALETEAVLKDNAKITEKASAMDVHQVPVQVDTIYIRE